MKIKVITTVVHTAVTEFPEQYPNWMSLDQAKALERNRNRLDVLNRISADALLRGSNSVSITKTIVTMEDL